MAKVSVNGGGIGNEPFWKSRRIWAIPFGIAGVVILYTLPEFKHVAVGLIGAAVTCSGLSWSMPK